jgi:hypothetical protein
MRVVLSLLAVSSILSLPVSGQGPTAAELMARVGAYAAGYGEKASVVVASATSMQTVTLADGPAILPTELVAEFAIV